MGIIQKRAERNGYRRLLNSRPNVFPPGFTEGDSSLFHCCPEWLNLWKSKDKHEAGDDLRQKNQQKKTQCSNSCWCCMNSQRLSGKSRESPCTPSWWCLPAGIDVPAPHQQLDTLPHSLWKRAPSSLPTPWLNRKALGQEKCWRTLVPSHGAGCEKTPTWNDVCGKEIQEIKCLTKMFYNSFL